MLNEKKYWLWAISTPIEPEYTVTTVFLDEEGKDSLGNDYFPELKRWDSVKKIKLLQTEIKL